MESASRLDVLRPNWRERLLASQWKTTALILGVWVVAVFANQNLPRILLAFSGDYATDRSTPVDPFTIDYLRKAAAIVWHWLMGAGGWALSLVGLAICVSASVLLRGSNWLEELRRMGLVRPTGAEVAALGCALPAIALLVWHVGLDLKAGLGLDWLMSISMVASALVTLGFCFRSLIELSGFSVGRALGFMLLVDVLLRRLPQVVSAPPESRLQLMGWMIQALLLTTLTVWVYARWRYRVWAYVFSFAGYTVLARLIQQPETLDAPGLPDRFHLVGGASVLLFLTLWTLACTKPLRVR